MYDTIIVGGGPAGLSAALVLGRCRRRVLVVDAGKGRNYAARSMHNYLSRDGIDPRELLRLGRAELAKYGVQFRVGLVAEAACGPGGFRVTIGEKGTRRVRERARTLLLATGVVDELPAIEGLRELYGLGVHHCPYCDGWEYRDRAIAAYGRGKRGVGLALNLLTWSKQVTVVTDGTRVPAAARVVAERLRIVLREEKITRLVAGPARGRGRAREGRLERIEFARGPGLRVDALFFNTDQWQRSGLPRGLGCRMDEKGGVVHDRRQRTGVPGLYLAGDASRDVQFVIVAAAEGARAGVAINSDLQKLDRGTV